MLKTKRLEYTFEFYRSQLQVMLANPGKSTLKDRADQNFVSELRFLTTRMIATSYLIGFQTAVFAYFGAFRHLKLYVGIPLTITTFALARNLTMKGSINRLYYPMEPLYNEVRRHQTVSAATPRGAKGVRDIERATQVLTEQSQTPLTKRDDLTKADKRKIMRQTKAMRQQSVQYAAE